MNEKVCAVAPQETLTSLADSLIQVTGAIADRVDTIHSKLFGARPCEAGNQPVIDDLESALRLIRSRVESIAKDVYSISERL